MSGFSHGLTHPDFPIPEPPPARRLLPVEQEEEFARRFRQGERRTLALWLSCKLNAVYRIARRLGVPAHYGLRLTPEQQDQFKRRFRARENRASLARWLGCDRTNVYRLAKRLGA